MVKFFATLKGMATDPVQRLQYGHYMNTHGMRRLLSFKHFLSISLAFYGVYFYMVARDQAALKYRVSVTRRVSRITGYLTSMPLPPHLRVLFYKGFGALYGVKFDEIQVENLNSFRTFNQFFTRELKEGARAVDTPEDASTIVSPCDGRVLSSGEVDCLESTMDCIKGHTYRVDEFLFGYQSKSETADQKTTTERILQSARDRGNKVMYMVVYLAPGDYHRFHSPATFTASYRRHIAGYLEPVDPRYLKGHRDVLKTNERVNLLGDWQHGFFAVSFVGAMNVGSIKLHFDESLKSNVASPGAMPYIDKNYQTLTELEGAFWKYPVRKSTLGRNSIDAFNPDEVVNVDQYLGEFDVKDMVTAATSNADFVYSATQESSLPFNVINSFKTVVESTEEESLSRELVSKLEQPGSMYARNKNFTVNSGGVFLRKGEEVGMFEMGSTIVMLFECPADHEILPQSGEKLLMGQKITQ